MRRFLLTIFVVAMVLSSCTSTSAPEKILINYNPEISQVQFAVEEISKSCTSQGIRLLSKDQSIVPDLTIHLKIDAELGFESYNLRQDKNQIYITGGDPNGLMYAGIDLAETIMLGKDLTTIDEVEMKPYVKQRGLRYNIPLDARTPSYDDTGDAAQHNIATVWDWDYWKDYLDQMALNRYNLLTIWSMHPYPSMVKVPEYPDVALDDVCIYTKAIDEKIHRSWMNEGIQDPENLEVILKLSMDEKIAHWKRVFNYAEERGIDIYLFHWNVFVNGAEGKHGIEWKQDHAITVDYIRKSVKAMLLTYPSIRGIGVTAGEHIDRSLTGMYQTENWMWHTYGMGILDAKAENPDLDVRFIFRMHWSDLNVIDEAFKEYPSQIETSFKYSRARMYSSTQPPWFDKIYRETVENFDTPCWLNIRNDDIFIFRWGDPEYAQDYIRNIPIELTPGFYMGPDGYVWGREFISKNPRSPRQLAVDKHWYRFRIWGRTAYNPTLSPEYWQDQIRLRFPETDPVHLYHTWKATSDIISLVDKIHFRQNDFQFLPEGCLDVDTFHDVNYFIKVAAMPLQGVVSISDFAKTEGDVEGFTPFDIAEQLEQASEVLIRGASEIDPGVNDELRETLGDMTAMGYLGRYYASKIRGATYTAMFRWSGNNDYKNLAVESLQDGVEFWIQYAEIANSLYHPQLFARTSMLNWDAVLEHVRKDVEIAQTSMYGENIEIIYDNILWNRNSSRL